MDKETLAKINALTRREFTEEELYTFPVTLCGNEIDRDFERFTDEALAEMQKLFVGKTIIQSHDPDTTNQVARIYDTELVETDELTSYGAPYKYLKGYAYMVRTESNADFITEIDAGIKREVSVSCSASRVCSVCGKYVLDEPCEHVKGAEYDGQVCHHILDGIADAYELSFVAVPAQPDAGVTKKAGSPRGQDSPNDRLRGQRSNRDTALSAGSGKGVSVIKSTKEGGIHMQEEFTPITTKAAFDAAAQPLIEAAVTAKAAEYEGWLSPEAHQEALDALTAQHSEAMRKAYREKAALLCGLPEALAARLDGDTEEDILKDAQVLSGLVSKSAHGTPHFEAETAQSTSFDGELLEMLHNMKG